MSHVIKISGISDELLVRVDERWKRQHFADRSEYVRDLIRRDVLAGNEPPVSLAERARQLFRPLHDQVRSGELSDDELSKDVGEALAEVRRSRKMKL